MSLATETSRIAYADEGQDTFPVPFQFLENAHIFAVLTDADGADSELSETADYTLTGAGSPEGGTLVLDTALAADETLTIYRELPITQPADYQNQDAFPAEAHETALDRITMICQQLSRELGQCVRFSVTSPVPDPIDSDSTPATVWGYDGDGNFVLRDSAALAEFLALSSGTLTGNLVATWAVDGDRAAKVPDYLGQPGVQRSDSSLWIATGLLAGNWTLAAIHDTTLAAASATRPPTQGSVKSYVDAQVLALQANIDAVEALIGDGGLVELPVGSIIPWFSDDPPDETWLFAHGQEISRTDYPDLFALWGSRYGNGNGTTTFNVPDLRGAFLRGMDNGKGADPDGATRVLGSYQADGIGAHTHNYSTTFINNTARYGPSGTWAVLTGTGTSGSNNGAEAETRPKNVAGEFMLKAIARGTGTAIGGWWDQWAFAQDEPCDNVTRFVGYTYQAMVVAHVFLSMNTTGSGTPTVQITVNGSNLFASAKTLALTKTVQQNEFAAAFAAGLIPSHARIECTVAGLPGCAVLAGWSGLNIAFLGRASV